MADGYEINTSISDNGDIRLETLHVIGNVRQRIMLDVMRTRDAMIREALIKLGWTPPDTCRKCGGHMKPSKAIEQTYVGSPDFPGHEAVTLRPGGQGNHIDCMKCSACGWSVTGGGE